MKQGTKTFTEFAAEVDALATQCQPETKQYTKERAMKDAIIFGTSDDRLRQETLAKDLDYETRTKAALGYEQSRKSSGTIKSSSGAAAADVRYTKEEVDDIVSRVMAGRYSVRKSY